MKVEELFENDKLATIKVVTQGLRFIDVKPVEVVVKYKKTPGSQAKACFNNAFKALSGAPDELYVLGFVFIHSVPIEHAWIKRGNEYFDVTLDPAKQHEYFSIAEFTFDQVFEYVDKYNTAPSLYDMNRFIGSSKRSA